MGLRQLGSEFVYRRTVPRDLRLQARAAVVLASPAELREAMRWKKAGGCRLLLAGPITVDDPRQHGRIITSPEVVPIVASHKMRESFERHEPSLKGRVRVWPAGVDVDYWAPSGRQARRTVLIYNKRMPELAEKLAAAISGAGYLCETITYGDHRRLKYRPINSGTSWIAVMCVCF